MIHTTPAPDDRSDISVWSRDLFPLLKEATLLPDNREFFDRATALAYSFPLWRFPAQRLQLENSSQLPSLMESFGMTRLERETDRWRESGKDRLGVGYSASLDDGSYIEFRRSYLLAYKEGLGLLVIRNSSPFFGRDSLSFPIYFSPCRFSDSELQGLHEQALDQRKYLNIFDPNGEHISAADALLGMLEAFDERFANWLLDPRAIGIDGRKITVEEAISPGFKYLTENLELRLAQSLKTGSPPPLLGVIEKNAPPWHPTGCITIGNSEIEEMKCLMSGKATLITSSIQELFALSPSRRFALLSGANGDWP